MKTYKVYIVKSFGNIAHIGYTGRTLERRLIEHKCNKLKGVNGLTIHLVEEFGTKKEARALEDLLQEENGMVTDTQKKRESASIGSKKRWDSMDLEERSMLNSISAFKRWENKSAEDRSIIIKKGHDTRKLKNKIK